MKTLPAIILAAAFFTLAASFAPAQSPAPAQPSSGLALSAVSPAPTPNPTDAAPAAAEPPADPDTAFTLGLAAYEKGNFAEARKDFMAAARTATSFALEYNLGNACYQVGDQAAAILHYLRALALDPRDPDARQNLALARQAVNLTAPDPTFLERVIAWMSLNAWTWMLTLFGWASAYLLFLPRLYRWRGALPWLLFTVCVILSGIAATALWQDHLHSHDGVVLRADTQLKLSPTANSQAIGVLQAGETAEALRQHSGYYYIRASDGRLGWVEALNYAPVYD
jgi:tetratricopeptide (TPR) repeat protein